LHIERKGDVVAEHLEMRVPQQMHDMVLGAGEVIVDAEHVETVGEQPFAQMRAEESGSPGHQNPFPQHAGRSPPFVLERFSPSKPKRRARAIPGGTPVPGLAMPPNRLALMRKTLRKSGPSSSSRRNLPRVPRGGTMARR